MIARRHWLGLAGWLSVTTPVWAEVPVIEIREPASVNGTGQSSVALGNPAGNEMVLLIQQLQDEVRTLRGTVEQQQRRIDLLEQQQRDRYRDVDRRLSLLFQSLSVDAASASAEGSAIPEVGQTPQQAAPATGQPAQGGSVKAEESAANTPNESVEQAGGRADREAYERVYALIRERQFEQANAALEAFIQDYPGSDLVPNAWYWKGEVHLARQQLEPAQTAFRHVIEQFAGHGKAADALYKLGVLFGRSGDRVQAENTMRKVIETYPQSSAADLARGYLAP
ncbi:tol-pal system protein YbgF [Marinobacterium sp. AK62]|uniref:Cell division coordinator CpoB n=1 Tax=Marinobacterium alkalitolerans TaxID=1542925 RepID=A0ABS3ZD56_9GAMM|nr:tol-pal system protein YbgF [Marinobacterium alkalitolerans]MBP0049641.1 tol-pal system protein YbgF [Marinobacterium alkalitolerans]